MRSIIFTADNHLTSKTPVYRTDDYAQTGLRKLDFLVDTANEHDAPLVFGGDIFDQAVGPLWFINQVIQRLQRVSAGCYSVFGQHDTHFHNPDLMRTQFGLLLVSGALQLIREFEVLPDVVLYGRSWDDPYPKSRTAGEYNILVAHATITKGMPPPWLTAQSAEEMIDAHSEFDLIVTGDFHEKFVVTKGKTTLLNCGPMLRQSIDKKDFQPACWLLNDDGIHEILIPIETDVFDVEAMAVNTKAVQAFDEEAMARFVDSLDFSGKEKPTFRQIVVKGLEDIEPEKTELIQTIQEVMDYTQGMSEPKGMREEVHPLISKMLSQPTHEE
jgi:hypothetical protein